MFRQGILFIENSVPADCVALQIRELARHGLEEVLLFFREGNCDVTKQLANMDAGSHCQVKSYLMEKDIGSGYALVRFRDLLDPCFLYRDAGIFFDVNCLSLADPQVYACAPQNESSAYGGIVGLSKESLAYVFSEADSLEKDLLPRLQGAGALSSPRMERPCHTLSCREQWPWRRPAVFFDRDGVINKDNGFVHRKEEFEWTPGAIEAIKLLNDTGWYVFVVTNQSGVARGYYPESAVVTLHGWMQQELARHSAHVDAYYYCPYYAKGTVPAYTREHPDRKPSPGMLHRAFDDWSVRPEGSFMIGDRPSDMETAKRAGILGFCFKEGNLEIFVREVLRKLSAAAASS